MIDVNIKMPDGSWTRVRKVSPVPTKRGAARYEREIRQAVLARGLAKEKEEPKQVPKKEKQPKPAATPAAKKTEAPTFASFAAYFIDTYATTNNRPSTVREKRRALGRGLLDELGRLRLDQITTRHVEAFKARRKRDGVGPKTINEDVAILGKILGYAEEIGELRQPPPKLRRLKVPRPKFDFLDFAEADRLVAEDPSGATITIDDHELTAVELGRLLTNYAGWGMRIVFVPDDEIDEEPAIEVREPDEG